MVAAPQCTNTALHVHLRIQWCGGNSIMHGTAGPFMSKGELPRLPYLKELSDHVMIQ